MKLPVEFNRLHLIYDRITLNPFVEESDIVIIEGQLSGI